MIRAAACLCLCAMGLAAQSHDWMIVPGERVGPITRDSTLDSLEKDFGPENVHSEVVNSGYTIASAVVYLVSPSRALSVVWDSRAEGAHPARIVVCYRDPSLDQAIAMERQMPEIFPPRAHPWDVAKACEWKTKEGITVGATLQELEHLNGRPFIIMGFGWAQGGKVVSWNGRLLEAIQTPGLDLQLTEGRSTLEDRRKVSAYVSYSSDNSLMRAVAPKVSFMTIGFPK